MNRKDFYTFPILNSELDRTFILKQSDNGYILTSFELNDNKEVSMHDFLYKNASRGEPNRVGLETLKEVLLDICDALGTFFSKHNEYNIDIDIKKNIGL